MEIEFKERVYISNKQNIRIRKWCASCQLKEIDNYGNRYCLLKNKKIIVDKESFCEDWQLAYSLKKAGVQSPNSPGIRDITEKIEEHRTFFRLQEEERNKQYYQNLKEKRARIRENQI